MTLRCCECPEPPCTCRPREPRATEAAEQVRAGREYIKRRYGNGEDARASWGLLGWYDAPPLAEEADR